MATDSLTLDVSPDDIPVNMIPCLTSLGATYNVLTGLYADARSCKQIVMDWNNAAYYETSFGANGKVWAIPDSVNFQSYVNTLFASNHGESTEEYTKSLASRTELGAEYPFFTGSVSVDYSSEETSSVANSFTRVMHNVNLYTLSLPPPLELQSLLRPAFKNVLDEADPIAIFEQYGTHVVNSLTAGGRASFTFATDARKYTASESVEVAASLTVKFLMGQLSAEEKVKYAETISNFQTSSTQRVLTQGGAPEYGNDSFLTHIGEWARSVEDYTAFVDFGSIPGFVPLWQLASTTSRQNVLKDAYGQYCRDFVPQFQISGPYLRLTPVKSLDACGKMTLVSIEPSWNMYTYPPSVDDLYYVSQPWSVGLLGFASTTYGAAISEIITGVLAPVVRWETVTTDSRYGRVWKGYGPNSDYVVLSNVCYSLGGQPPAQPPTELVKSMRAIHRCALKAAKYANEFPLKGSSPGGSIWSVSEEEFDKPINEKKISSPWRFTASGVAPLDDPYVWNMDEVVIR
ncbi:hypothetical protein A0H81_06203 [Grifola frondosa]|uniref:MACPF domain-containing protein n=1 Tax=Grifola frondosa TaxID=5627 RepID=A0A1C7MB63_GRIFR|nr:hypothetical protein A0H81_06203 [Grifola frondosa]